MPGWYGAGERTIEIASATAVWRHAGLPVVPIRWVLIRDPQHRFAPQALLCTDPARDPAQIVRWFVRRWQVEVTFQEARAHLGVETQRQWSDRAIARTTPCLLALFSIVTLLAARLTARARRRVAPTAWYRKPQPTFSDALAAVRRPFWREQGLRHVTPREATEQNSAPPSATPGPTRSAMPPERPKIPCRLAGIGHASALSGPEGSWPMRHIEQTEVSRMVPSCS